LTRTAFLYCQGLGFVLGRPVFEACGAMRQRGAKAAALAVGVDGSCVILAFLCHGVAPVPSLVFIACYIQII